jgi:N-acetylglucosamine repressor
MQNSPLGNRDLIRAINRSIVLNAIKNEGPIGRAELARSTGLSPATVSAITAELIEDGLVFAKQTGDSSGGRRPILLALNPTGGYVVGIKLTEQMAIGALTDLEATVVAKQNLALTDATPEAALEIMTRLTYSLLDQARVSRARLLGVGIGLAGIVDFHSGMLRVSPFFDWRDLPLAEMLQSRLHTPVYIDNDVNTLTLAEKWFGAGQEISDFLVITLGRGVGLGIVVNGQFYRGAGGGAGEFGHTVVEPDGPTCECGKRGCLEAIVGDPGLLRQASQAYQQGELAKPVQTIQELLALAQAGDPAARQIYQHTGQVLGTAIANLVNLFNPRLIIIGGEGVRAGNFLFDTIQSTLDQECMPPLRADVTLQIEPWGDDSWARGAASLVLRDLFESPVNQRKSTLAGLIA